MKIGATACMLSVWTMIVTTSVPAQEQRLAERLVELTRIEQVMDVTIDQMMQGWRQGWLNSIERQRREGARQEKIDWLTKLLPKLETIIREEAKEMGRTILPDLKPAMVGFYEEKLSSEELAELVDALERPSVQKLYDLHPETTQIVLDIMARHSAASEQRASRRIEEVLSEALKEAERVGQR